MFQRCFEFLLKSAIFDFGNEIINAIRVIEGRFDIVHQGIDIGALDVR